MIARAFHCPNCDHELLPAAVLQPGVTRRTKDLMAFVLRYIADHGMSPTYDEIAAALGMGRRSQVGKVVGRAVALGVLTSGHKTRTLVVTEAGASFVDVTREGGAHA
jgi:SOS-response transcriptional repressor LexA